jgi:hypothetical protein
MKNLIFISLLLIAGCATTNRTVQDFATKTFYPVIQENDQELQYINGFRYVLSTKDNSNVAGALYYADTDLYLMLFVENLGERFTIDFPNIKIVNEQGNPVHYFTGDQFLAAKAEQIQSKLSNYNIMSAYVNNEMNKGNIHLANDYVTSKPGDKEYFDEVIGDIYENIWRPKTLNKGERSNGRIYFAEYYYEINVIIEAGKDTHRLKYELK